MLEIFLDRFAVWLLIALCIAIYSRSSLRCVVKCICIFCWNGFQLLYIFQLCRRLSSEKLCNDLGWLYSYFSISLAFICWYAKGESKISFMLSVIIIAILFNFTFIYGWIYFDIYSILEVIVFCCGLVALKRNTIKETAYMILSAVVIAVILNLLVPFHFS